MALPKRNSSLLSVDLAVEEQFLLLFVGDYNGSHYRIIDGRWDRLREPLDLQVFLSLSAAEVIVGVELNYRTQLFTFDVDWGSRYHPSKDPQAFKHLLDCLEEIGLCRPIPLSSSESKGIHVHYWLDRVVASRLANRTISEHLKRAGFILASGVLEILPRNLDGPQCLRLPLQQGSFLLNEDWLPYSSSKADYLKQMQWSKAGNDASALVQAASPARRLQRRPDGVWGHIAVDEQGLPIWDSWHQSNDRFLYLGWLAVMRENCYGVRQVAARVVELASQCQGFTTFSRHVADLNRRAKEVARWAWKKFGTGYRRAMASPVIDGSHINAERQADALERIKEAIVQLEARGALFSSMSAARNAISKLAQASVRTVKKYLSQWSHLIAGSHPLQNSDRPQTLENNAPITPADLKGGSCFFKKITFSSDGKGGPGGKPKCLVYRPYHTQEMTVPSFKPVSQAPGVVSYPISRIQAAWSLGDFTRASSLAKAAGLTLENCVRALDPGTSLPPSSSSNLERIPQPRLPASTRPISVDPPPNVLLEFTNLRYAGRIDEARSLGRPYGLDI